MTSSSTLTTWNNTENMSAKSSNASKKITSTLVPINVTSTPTPWSTSATCYLWLVSQWSITRSRPSKNGLKCAKSRTFSPFLDLQIFIRDSFFNYSDITILLMRLTKKGIAWNFTLECRESFETLKKAFTTALVLTHWVPNTQIILKTDTSNYSLAAILSSYLQMTPKFT